METAGTSPVPSPQEGGEESLDFQNRNLSGEDFSGRDLRKACFERARLNGVDFRNGDLREANFRNANCVSARFDEANL